MKPKGRLFKRILVNAKEKKLLLDQLGVTQGFCFRTRFQTGLVDAFGNGFMVSTGCCSGAYQRLQDKVGEKSTG